MTVAIDDSVSIKQAFADACSDVDTAIEKALEEIGITAERYAKAECPVDTGKLRDSITHVVDDNAQTVSVGTNVTYAPYVELGTSEQKAQPFLKPAVTEHLDEYRKIIESELKS